MINGFNNKEKVEEKGRIYCLVRKEWVAFLPEEVVRQQLIGDMLALGYPQSHLLVEKEIKALLCHRQRTKAIPPLRRADIVCFAKGFAALGETPPLLLIECKAVPFSQQVIRQVVGYNYYVQAHYVCIANQTQRKTGWYEAEKGGYIFIDRLPSYQELIAAMAQAR